MKRNVNPVMDQEPTRESFILYAPWYKCISEFSKKSQALAFKALCEYALFNIPIPKAGFSSLEYGALISFIPVIDSNHKRYENGKKGAAHGSKGGRPKKQETPMGLIEETPNENANKKVIDNLNINVGDEKSSEDISTPPSYEYIYNLLLPIFFFKNCNAHIELKRFFDHYRLADWRLKGGDLLDTPKSLKVAAERWKAADTQPRFPQPFINLWREVYEMAPETLKNDVLEISPIARQQMSMTIACSASLHSWIYTPEIRQNVIKLVQEKMSESFKLNIVTKNTTK